MVAASHTGGGVGNQPVVDLHDPGRLGQSAAAPAYKGVDVRKAQAVVFHKVLDKSPAQGDLIVDGGVGQQQRRIVKDALGIDIFVVFKIAHLGGGGAGVDDQHFIDRFHGNLLLGKIDSTALRTAEMAGGGEGGVVQGLKHFRLGVVIQGDFLPVHIDGGYALGL